MTVRSRAVTRVLLIGVRHPGVVRAANRAELQVHYLGAREAAPSWLNYSADSVCLLDDPSPEFMLVAAQRIYAENPFGAAVSMTDMYVGVAAEINQMFELQGNIPAVPRTVNDKARMRAALRDSTVGTVTATRVSSAYDMKRFASDAGYPFIVSPEDTPHDESRGDDQQVA